jgi:hypothetical protein
MHVHYPHRSGALCGALHTKAITSDPRGVTCPLCCALLDGRALAHGAIDLIEQGVATKLADVQRDPRIRVLAGLVHRVLRAEKNGNR